MEAASGKNEGSRLQTISLEATVKKSILAKRGARINAISPGIIVTPLAHDELMANAPILPGDAEEDARRLRWHP